MKGKTVITLLAALLLPLRAFAQSGTYNHMFIIMLENVGYEAVIGNTVDAPYINNTLLPQSALYTNSYGLTRPSLPNYLALFSGSTWGLTSEHCSDGPFPGPDLYSRLHQTGFTILGYMEDLPATGSEVCSYHHYAKRHNPFPFFSDVPSTEWVPYAGPYPANHPWPNFTWITPNTIDDMHDGTDIHIKVHNGDVWLSHHLPPIIQYAKVNNGLVILTMDEGENANHIPTILTGARVTGGSRHNQIVNHYNTLRAITNNFGVACLGNACGVPGLY